MPSSHSLQNSVCRCENNSKDIITYQLGIVCILCNDCNKQLVYGRTQRGQYLNYLDFITLIEFIYNEC